MKENSINKSVDEIYDDRNRVIGWRCTKCKQVSPFLSTLQHLVGCGVERKTNG
jgi:hypothetical protein